jgi:hypothetical protein
MTSNMNNTTHTSALLNGAGEKPDRRLRERIANLRANAQTVAQDLPDPAAAGYLLLLFDQCRLYGMAHEQLVEVFGRRLLAFVDLTLQAVEKLAARGQMGKAEAEDETPPAPRRSLTPYQLARLRDLAGEYVGALPDGRALEALLLLYDVLEVFELSPGSLETVFGAGALRAITGLVYGELGEQHLPPTGGGEATQYDLPAAGEPQTPTIRVNGRPVPFFGTVGENGHITYTPEARLWLRYIGKPEDIPSSPTPPASAGKRQADGGEGSAKAVQL